MNRTTNICGNKVKHIVIFQDDPNLLHQTHEGMGVSLGESTHDAIEHEFQYNEDSDHDLRSEATGALLPDEPEDLEEEAFVVVRPATKKQKKQSPVAAISSEAKQPATKGKATANIQVKGASKNIESDPAATSTPRKNFHEYTPTKPKAIKKRGKPEPSVIEKGATQAFDTFSQKLGEITDVIVSSQQPKAAPVVQAPPALDDSIEMAYADWLKVLGSKMKRMKRDDIDDFCHDVDEVAYKYMKQAKKNPDVSLM